MATYHIVAPISHSPFEVVCTTIRLTEPLKPLHTEQLILLLLGYTTHGTTQRRGQREVGSQVVSQTLFKLVEYGNLYVDQKP